MYGSKSFIIFWNCAMSSDCAPSLMAFSGAGCTSTINPSAPIATPARESAGTRLLLPVAWLGSRITGRCVNSFSAGIAAISQVFRVTVSKVRIPRSHKITSGFPCAVMYSADINNSFTVLLSPRFSNTGCLHVPRAHLHHVRVLRDQIDVAVTHHFRDNRQAGRFFGFLQQLQSFFFHAL